MTVNGKKTQAPKMFFINTVLVCVSDGHCAIDVKNRRKDILLLQSLTIQAHCSFFGVEGNLHVAFLED